MGGGVRVRGWGCAMGSGAGGWGGGAGRGRGKWVFGAGAGLRGECGVRGAGARLVWARATKAGEGQKRPCRPHPRRRLGRGPNPGARGRTSRRRLAGKKKAVGLRAGGAPARLPGRLGMTALDSARNAPRFLSRTARSSEESSPAGGSQPGVLQKSRIASTVHAWSDAHWARKTAEMRVAVTAKRAGTAAQAARCAAGVASTAQPTHSATPIKSGLRAERKAKRSDGAKHAHTRKYG